MTTLKLFLSRHLLEKVEGYCRETLNLSVIPLHFMIMVIDVFTKNSLNNEWFLFEHTKCRLTENAKTNPPLLITHFNFDQSVRRAHVANEYLARG